MTQYAPVIGGILVISGLLLLLDQRLQTRWLSMSIPAFISLALILSGIIRKHVWWIVSGLILAGLGTALVLFLAPTLTLDISSRLGYALLAQGAAWGLIFLLLALTTKKIAWYALLIAAVGAALSFNFIARRNTLFDFVYFVTLAIGFVFIIWGVCTKKVSLIIPGAILATTGAGVYYGWSNPEAPGGLQKTGIMLAWFAFGWLLITVITRVSHKRFTWWPLIPGGILLMVGAGLYIGGNPQNALGFLGNTGSIGMILIGVYLIFLKFGMKR
ncbi:MAG TPA: hypothetical protein PKZ26_04505 [Anaerolineaceae bacterium]|nr:hypothetical protein [Anaerolineaceae bacterium]HUM62916.1 hypothetical protein [Anaerolineaceae bacterium]